MSSDVMDNTNENLNLNGHDFKSLIHAGLRWLKANQHIVNALNVFPVPDGDTGTNMVLTMQAAYDEIKDENEGNIGKVAHAVAQGALMGARGNSGVILSQIWRGFARALDNLETMDTETLILGFEEATATAYKGVVRPVEGTILTVTKDIAIEAKQSLSNETTIDEIIDIVISSADKSVENTPNLLPILKQAKVVDSGGKGLFYILEGMSRLIRNEPLDKSEMTTIPIALMDIDQSENIEPGQDYEVVIDFRPNQYFELQRYYDQLEQIGTSIQVGEGDDIFRMHIHVATEKRYEPIDYTMNQGTITKVYIENLLDQMENKPKGNSSSKKGDDIQFNAFEPGSIAVVAASPGLGISEIFASLGVTAIVKGGQTMNPSTEEILSSFKDLPTDKIIILPNNKNIILAAQAAASVTDKKVAVIPCKTVPQGINALLRLMPGMDFDVVVSDMIDACDEVETGEVTIATRTVEINGVNVSEGQVIALHNGKLIQSCSSIEEATLSILSDSNMNDRERVTFLYGADIDIQEVSRIASIVENKYPEHEVEIHYGGQPYYQFILSIE